MTNRDAQIINACIKHENPVYEALQNKCFCTNYRTRVYGPTFKKFKSTNSHARILMLLLNNPGLTRKQCREQLNYNMQCLDVFCNLSHMKLVYNKRPGYFITELGIALLHHYNMI